MLPGVPEVMAPGGIIICEHLKEEAVDVFHFAISVALAAGMDAQELFERYQSKNRENIARQQGLSSKPGYDVHELEP